MYYLKNLFLNFFIVFFANYIVPGIDATDQTKLPHLGSDVIFAIVLGFLNSLIYPLLKLINQLSKKKIAIIACVMNLIGYGSLKLLTIGIQLISVSGYFIVVGVVVVFSFLTNFLAMKHGNKEPLPEKEGESPLVSEE